MSNKVMSGRMRLKKAGYIFYKAARTFVGITGLNGPARKLLSPIAGRMFLKLSASGDRPIVVHGHNMVLASGAGYPPIDMAMGKYEPETTNLLLKLIMPGMVVLDVGAHVGYYTLLAARQTGVEGKVYSFEPEPNNHSTLLQNIELNGYQNVVVSNIAIASELGESTLYVSGLDNGRHSVYQHNLPVRRTVSVKTTTIDTFLESEGWPNVDLVKIDVEGAEMSVLNGMAKLQERSEDLKLIVEFNPSLLTNAGNGATELISELDRMGFSVATIDEKTGVQPMKKSDTATLTQDLVNKGISINLFCNRR